MRAITGDCDKLLVTVIDIDTLFHCSIANNNDECKGYPVKTLKIIS